MDDLAWKRDKMRRQTQEASKAVASLYGGIDTPPELAAPAPRDTVTPLGATQPYTLTQADKTAPEQPFNAAMTAGLGEYVHGVGDVGDMVSAPALYAGRKVGKGIYNILGGTAPTQQVSDEAGLGSDLAAPFSRIASRAGGDLSEAPNQRKGLTGTVIGEAIESGQLAADPNASVGERLLGGLGAAAGGTAVVAAGGLPTRVNPGKAASGYVDRLNTQRILGGQRPIPNPVLGPGGASPVELAKRSLPGFDRRGAIFFEGSAKTPEEYIKRSAFEIKDEIKRLAESGEIHQYSPETVEAAMGATRDSIAAALRDPKANPEIHKAIREVYGLTKKEIASDLKRLGADEVINKGDTAAPAAEKRPSIEEVQARLTKEYGVPPEKIPNKVDPAEYNQAAQELGISPSRLRRADSQISKEMDYGTVQEEITKDVLSGPPPGAASVDDIAAETAKLYKTTHMESRPEVAELVDKIKGMQTSDIQKVAESIGLRAPANKAKAVKIIEQAFDQRIASMERSMPIMTGAGSVPEEQALKNWTQITAEQKAKALEERAKLSGQATPTPEVKVRPLRPSGMNPPKADFTPTEPTATTGESTVGTSRMFTASKISQPKRSIKLGESKPLDFDLGNPNTAGAIRGREEARQAIEQARSQGSSVNDLAASYKAAWENGSPEELNVVKASLAGLFPDDLKAVSAAMGYNPGKSIGSRNMVAALEKHIDDRISQLGGKPAPTPTPTPAPSGANSGQPTIRGQAGGLPPGGGKQPPQPPGKQPPKQPAQPIPGTPISLNEHLKYKTGSAFAGTPLNTNNHFQRVAATVKGKDAPATWEIIGRGQRSITRTDEAYRPVAQEIEAVKNELIGTGIKRSAPIRELKAEHRLSPSSPMGFSALHIATDSTLSQMLGVKLSPVAQKYANMINKVTNYVGQLAENVRVPVMTTNGLVPFKVKDGITRFVRQFDRDFADHLVAGDKMGEEFVKQLLTIPANKGLTRDELFTHFDEIRKSFDNKKSFEFQRQIPVIPDWFTYNGKRWNVLNTVDNWIPTRSVKGSGFGHFIHGQIGRIMLIDEFGTLGADGTKFRNLLDTPGGLLERATAEGGAQHRQEIESLYAALSGNRSMAGYDTMARLSTPSELKKGATRLFNTMMERAVSLAFAKSTGQVFPQAASTPGHIGNRLFAVGEVGARTVKEMITGYGSKLNPLKRGVPFRRTVADIGRPIEDATTATIQFLQGDGNLNRYERIVMAGMDPISALGRLGGDIQAGVNDALAVKVGMTHGRKYLEKAQAGKLGLGDFVQLTDDEVSPDVINALKQVNKSKKPMAPQDAEFLYRDIGRNLMDRTQRRLANPAYKQKLLNDSYWGTLIKFMDYTFTTMRDFGGVGRRIKSIWDTDEALTRSAMGAARGTSVGTHKFVESMKELDKLAIRLTGYAIAGEASRRVVNYVFDREPSDLEKQGIIGTIAADLLASNVGGVAFMLYDSLAQSRGWPTPWATTKGKRNRAHGVDEMAYATKVIKDAQRMANTVVGTAVETTGMASPGKRAPTIAGEAGKILSGTGAARGAAKLVGADIGSKRVPFSGGTPGKKTRVPFSGVPSQTKTRVPFR